MQLSTAGLELIKTSEGFRAKTYLDLAGNPTIGYGHRLTPRECYPDGICATEADVILRWDVREAEQSVARLVRVPLTQGQFDALVDFTFNLGSGRLASSTLLQSLNAGNYDAAASELLRWDHSGAHEIASLKARREAEFRLWTGSKSPQQAAA
jgi:lysozyme